MQFMGDAQTENLAASRFTEGMLTQETDRSLIRTWKSAGAKPLAQQIIRAASTDHLLQPVPAVRRPVALSRLNPIMWMQPLLRSGGEDAAGFRVLVEHMEHGLNPAGPGGAFGQVTQLCSSSMQFGLIRRSTVGSAGNCSAANFVQFARGGAVRIAPTSAATLTKCRLCMRPTRSPLPPAGDRLPCGIQYPADSDKYEIKKARARATACGMVPFIHTGSISLSRENGMLSVSSAQVGLPEVAATTASLATARKLHRHGIATVAPPTGCSSASVTAYPLTRVMDDRASARL